MNWVTHTVADWALFETALVMAGATEPRKVAAAQERIKIKSRNGDVQMRESDYQLPQGQHITTWQQICGDFCCNTENTSRSFASAMSWRPDVVGTPANCQIKRLS